MPHPSPSMDNTAQLCGPRLYSDFDSVVVQWYSVGTHAALNHAIHCVVCLTVFCVALFVDDLIKKSNLVTVAEPYRAGFIRSQGQIKSRGVEQSKVKSSGVN